MLFTCYPFWRYCSDIMVTTTRTDVVLDDDLIDRAKELTGLDTKRAVLEEALRTLIRLREQEGIRALRGSLCWERDLDEVRKNRLGDPA